ncbi:MAG: hypothetical protein OSB69_09145 [Alphaproteobacteria bacterium]|nr:hypothetical protein [Alphaproteobacteria bacterium]
MARFFKFVLIVFAVALITPHIIDPAFAASDNDEDLNQTTKDRKPNKKEQKQKPKKFNEDRLYRFMVGPDVLPVGPFRISLYIRGQLVVGNLRIAIQAKDMKAKAVLEGEKLTINGMVYLLALRMWENGRPTTENILNFKSNVRSQLQKRYPKQVKDVFIESIM